MTIKGDVLTSTDELAKKCFNMIKTFYKKEYSEIFEMFYGIHVSKVVSTCKTYTNTTPESFFLLTLPIPCRNANLIQCLDEYTAIETLDGDNMLEIDDNGTKGVCKKQILFLSFPKILVIMLKRFGNNWQHYLNETNLISIGPQTSINCRKIFNHIFIFFNSKIFI